MVSRWCFAATNDETTEVNSDLDNCIARIALQISLSKCFEARVSFCAESCSLVRSGMARREEREGSE
jgi:hypothetical protein